jgi:hypothetical protein
LSIFDARRPADPLTPQVTRNLNLNLHAVSTGGFTKTSGPPSKHI